MSFFRDLKVAFHSLMRSKGLATIVILTLALGIGANAAIFTLVRGVLLKPLVNRDENRLIYIRQSAHGLGDDNVTFSVPEIKDIEGGVHSVSEFGDFSTMGFTMLGLGEPRGVRGGVVSGNYFEVMGLRPVLGRLIGPEDDGQNAAGVIVLTYRFWSSVYKKDPNVIGKTVRLSSLGDRSATVIGVLEPSVPYPADTEIIGNMVTSPHHLSATMVTGRVHRMTELFGKLAPGATLDQARAELSTVYATMQKDHQDAYPDRDGLPHRDAHAPRRDYFRRAHRSARPSGCFGPRLHHRLLQCCQPDSRAHGSPRRRTPIRAALGASTGALRRMLLAESLLLCGAGAGIALIISQPLVTILARYASRFSVRALDLTVDFSMLWVGAALAIVAAVILAYVPRLPSANAANGMNLASGSVRITSSTGRRQRIFAVTQIAASFVLLAGASMLITTLIALQKTQTGVDTRRVLVVDVPALYNGKTIEQVLDFYKETIRRIDALPGVTDTAVASIAPWRDADTFGPGLQFSGDGHVHDKDDPRAMMRTISPGFFNSLGVPLLEGRDFNSQDDQTHEPVAVVSQSLASRMFPAGDAVGHHVYWTDPVLEFLPGTDAEKARFKGPHRIIGIVADVDDLHIVPTPTSTIYGSFADGGMFGGHLFIHTTGNPYALVTPVTKIVRDMSADEPAEHAATLEDIRAKVLAPDRLNSLVFGVFAAVALLIAVVGVAGVLAFSVSARTREFGIRLALGAQPENLLRRVVTEGVVMAGIGVVAGAVFGLIVARVAGSYFGDLKMPGAWPVIVSAIVLLGAAVVASMLPAARAARVDVIQALHSE